MGASQLTWVALQRNFGRSRLACIPRKICLFLKNRYIYISKYYKFVFSGQIRLKIIADLLKKALVLHKRYLPFWQLLPTYSGFKSYASGVLTNTLVRKRESGETVLEFAQMKLETRLVLALVPCVFPKIK